MALRTARLAHAGGGEDIAPVTIIDASLELLCYNPVA